jgi:concanavalin A-like lectin/glucanase superfamily protein/uncharacterized protein DUF2341/fibrillar collagen-like protein/fibrinogen beta/gamma subunit family protein
MTTNKIKNFFRKLDYRYYLGIFVVGILIIGGAIFIFRAPKTTEAAPWFNDGWLYRQQFDVYNNESSALTNFQVTISTSTLQLIDLYNNEKLNSDFSDLRFTNHQGQELDYWFESATSTIHSIYVKFSNLPASATSTLFMYYGNASASDDRKDGNDMFYFFDDFEGSGLNTSIWYEGNASHVYSNSELRINTYGIGLQSPLSFNLNDGYTLEGKVKYLDTSTTYAGTMSGCSSRFGQSGNTGGDAIAFYVRNTLNLTEYIGDGSTNSYNISSGGTVSGTSNDVWYVLGQKIYSDGIDYLLNREEKTSHTSITWSKNMNYIELGMNMMSNLQDTVYDWVLVRSYTDTEPTSTITAGVSEENAPGPVGYWNFDEGYGTTAYDSTGYKNDATFVGDPTWVQNGKKGGALHFDGNDYLSIPKMINQENTEQEWSVSAWVKIEEKSNQELLDLNRGIHLHLGTTNKPILYLNASPNDYYDYGNYNLQDDEWHHVVFVFRNSDGLREIYVDTTEISLTGPNQTSTPSGIASTLRLGEGVLGLIDEVRVYDTAISEDQIKQLYNQNAGSFNVGQSRIPRSCADQLAMNPSSTSGNYTIDPGYGVDPLEVYCDMTTEGGGWTRVMWNNTTGSAVAPDDIMVNSYDESDHWSIDPEEMSRMLDSQDVMLKQVSQVDVWPSSWSSLVATSTGNWDYDQPLCTGFLLGHSGRSAGCANHGANDDYGSADGLNIAIYTDTSGGNSTDAFVPKYSYDYYSGSSNTGHIEFYIREDIATTTHGLVLDLPFETESSNTTYDKSGYENDGTITNATWKGSEFCKQGRCFDFNGTSDYINVSSPTPIDVFTDDYTVSFWVYPENLSKENYFFSSSYGSSPSILLYWAGEIRFIENEGGVTYFFESDDVDLDENQWYYLTLKRSGTDLYLYVNGVQRATATSTGIDVSSEDYQIGWAVPRNKSTAYFEGLIDQVKVYDVALTQREIMEEMSAGKPGPILDIDFNESGGDTAYDKSGQDNDGTLISSPTWQNENNCVSGSCLEFDGSSYVNCGSGESFNLGSGNWTYSFWAKTDVDDNYRAIVSQGLHSVNGQWEIYRNYLADYIRWAGTDDGGTYKEFSTNMPNDNVWRHYTFQRDGNYGKIYVDGLLKTNANVFSGLTYNSDYDLAIGAINADSGGWYWDGYIDEVKIYPYALTVQEIKQDYVQSKGQFGQTNAVGAKTNPGASCSDILARKTDAPDGKYWIDPTGGSISDKFEVYCDMTREGGGWSLAARIYKDNSDFLYTDTEWNTTGTEFGSMEPDETDFRSSVFGNLDKTQLMICDDHTYGCNVDSDFSSLETLSETIAAAPEGQSGVALTKTMETYNWGTNYCQFFWNSSTYRVNLEDNDGDPKARFISTVTTDGVGGIGYSNSTNMGIYNSTCGGDDTDIPDYVELYVKESTIVSNDIGPILDMDFDQYSGGVYLDKSGNGYNGTPSGDPEQKGSEFCKKGRCLEFDGDDRISVADNTDLRLNDNFTISFWAQRTDDTFDYPGITRKGGASASGDGYLIFSNNGVVYFKRDNLQNSWGSGTNLDIGDPLRHYVITYDGSDVVFYSNGSQTNTWNQSFVTNTNTDILYIGSNGSNYHDGLIDEFKMYNRVLTQAEISNLYNGGKPIGHWRFDEGDDNLCSDGADVCDNSGEGNNGTINGDPIWITDTSQCKQGGCMDFNGIGDYVDLGTYTINNDLSISGWFKTDSSNGDMVILAPSTGNGILTDIGLDVGHFSWDKTGSVGYKETVNTYNDGNWHHFVIVTEDDKIYIDGKDQILQTGTMYRSSSEFLIGARYLSSYSQYFDGSLDDIRIYNYALSDEQVSEIYNGGLIKFK